MMRKIILYVLILAGVGFIAYSALKAPGSAVFDARNSSFKIENIPVTLRDGTDGTTRYFGNEIKHDLDNDGREDSVFLVTSDGGGSGTFYHVVAVLDTAEGYKGSNSYLLGDRIALQSTSIDEGLTSRGTRRDNVIVVNYAVRGPNEPMTTAPSIGKSVWLKLDPVTMEFGVVEQDFEG